MHILITGSKGLIGSALKRALQLLYVEVLGIDIKCALQDPEYGDILNPEQLFPLIKQVDGIVHLAAISRVIDGEKNPQLCSKTNVEGTKNILEAALASEKNPWVIYASSREVYGQQNDFPVKESAPLSPVNIYGESKFEAEKIVLQAREKGLHTAIIRFSNVFGSVHDHPDRVVPAFCLAAAQGSEIRVDGRDHLFDFTYLEDVIQGLLSLIRLMAQKKELLPPIHLTRGIPISLGQIAQVARQSSVHPLKIIEGIPRSFDVSRFWGDTSLAKKLLNWEACTPVEAGMHWLINQFTLFLLG